MRRFLVVLMVVAFVSLTANSCLAYIGGPHWTTSEARTVGR